MVLFQGGGDCNTLVLTPFALNIHDTYIVNNHGAELKEMGRKRLFYSSFTKLTMDKTYRSRYPTTIPGRKKWGLY